MTSSIVHIALALALVESIALAGFLAARARAVPGGLQLVLFLVGVALWIAGNELPTWAGPSAIPWAEGLIGFASLTAVVFLHFAIRFGGANVPNWAVSMCYALGGTTTLLAFIWPPGNFSSWLGFDYMFRPSPLGWVVGSMWALFGALGHFILALSWMKQTPGRRRQLTAVCLSSGLGLLSMSGYASPALGWNVFPYPLFLLPLYPVILVYGILRYALMVANVWARRTLAFALLAGCGIAVATALAMVPLPGSASGAGWAIRCILVIAAIALVDPMRKLATRIVYPGFQITDEVMTLWRDRLGRSANFNDLARTAEELLQTSLKTPIQVTVSVYDVERDSEIPSIFCSKSSGRWLAELAGWESVPPGLRQMSQTFSVLLAESAAFLDHAEERAAGERDTQQQARLAELGSLAAIVAHDIRNPLNIISMATASASPDVRSEISGQIRRISQLSQDLLDYSKSWRFDAISLDLSVEVRHAITHFFDVMLSAILDEPLEIMGDPQRLRQALINLIDNARAAYPADAPAQPVGIEAERSLDGSIELHICDNGRGIPDAIRDSLFQPFVSRSSNGTGLGLAIVAKVMEAHNGSVQLTERAGWKSCFTLSFPGITRP